MKKFAAILLCGIFFFNWVGYRLLDHIVEANGDRRLDARLDRNQYDDDQLITIKVPVKELAYYINSPQFERINGAVEIKGIPYRYVKRRIYNDSLEMLCIPNQTALHMRQTGGDFFRLVTGIVDPQQSGSRPGSHKSFSTDPFICLHALQIATLSFIDIGPVYPRPTSLVSLSLPTDERPPAIPAA